jgi:hypothetical protein
VEKINVNLPLLRNIVRKVSPLVERLIHWNLALKYLDLKVLPKTRGYEEGVLGRLKGLGVSFQENGLARLSSV